MSTLCWSSTTSTFTFILRELFSGFDPERNGLWWWTAGVERWRCDYYTALGQMLITCYYRGIGPIYLSLITFEPKPLFQHLKIRSIFILNLNLLTWAFTLFFNDVDIWNGRVLKVIAVLITRGSPLSFWGFGPMLFFCPPGLKQSLNAFGGSSANLKRTTNGNQAAFNL